MMNIYDSINTKTKLDFYQSKEYYPIILVPQSICDDIDFSYNIFDYFRSTKTPIQGGISLPQPPKLILTKEVWKKKWTGRNKKVKIKIYEEDDEIILDIFNEFCKEIQDKIGYEITLQRDGVMPDYFIKKVGPISQLLDKTKLPTVRQFFIAHFPKNEISFNMFDLGPSFSEPYCSFRIWIENHYLPKYQNIYELLKKNIIAIFDYFKEWDNALGNRLKLFNLENGLFRFQQEFEECNKLKIYKSRFIESNHHRIKDIPQKGNTEQFFLSFLHKSFNNFIDIDCKVGQYYPDFIYYDINSKIKIDIEIDEMFSSETKLPIHEIGGSDESRNSFFLDKNWLVMRFTDEQVANYPEQCCQLIESIIYNLNNPLRQRKINHQIPQIKRWSYVDAMVVGRKR